MGSQASDDGVDVVDCECEMADARGVRRRVRVAARARRGVELRQLDPSVAASMSNASDESPFSSTYQWIRSRSVAAPAFDEMRSLATVSCVLLSSLLAGANAHLSVGALAGLACVGLISLSIVAAFGVLRAAVDCSRGDD